MKKKMMIDEVLIQHSEVEVGEMLSYAMLHNIFGYSDVVEGIFAGKIGILRIEFEATKKEENYRENRQERQGNTGELPYFFP